MCKLGKLIQLNNNDFVNLPINESFYELSKINSDIEYSNDTFKNENCSICSSRQDNMLKLHCGHIYCLECYNKHIKMINKIKEPHRCCICRRNFRDTKITLFNINNKQLISTNSTLKKIIKLARFYSNDLNEIKLFNFILKFFSIKYITSNKNTINTNTFSSFVLQHLNDLNNPIILGRNQLNEYKQLRLFGFTNIMIMV